MLICELYVGLVMANIWDICWTCNVLICELHVGYMLGMLCADI